MKKAEHKCLAEGIYDMLTLLFSIFMLLVFGKLLFFGIKAAWGISKFILTIVLLPISLILMVVGGLMSLAFSILKKKKNISLCTTQT